MKNLILPAMNSKLFFSSNTAPEGLIALAFTVATSSPYGGVVLLLIFNITFVINVTLLALTTCAVSLCAQYTFLSLELYAHDSAAELFRFATTDIVALVAL
jgi:hypothetical protein